jgi:hypothetical protein
MATSEIGIDIGELYGPGVSRETVSRVTASALQDDKAWQARPRSTRSCARRSGGQDP